MSALIKSAPRSLDAVFGGIARFPQRLEKGEFYSTAYPAMYVARQLDIRFKELFRKGLVKGTVIIAAGNEASSVGMAMPFTPGKDIAALLHRNLGSHLILGCDPFSAVCQYMANAQSPTHGKEGNVHFGDTDALRFPMVSHLGSMLAVAVGSTWSARRNGKDAFGLTVIGDGGSSTGQFHEALNMASVNKVPVVFMIENNGYAFSTPVENQYCCKSLSDRAAGYGIKGRTVNGLDAYEVYSAVTDALELMASSPQPVLIESMTVRLEGHAVYDNAEYISDEVKAENWKKDPIVNARAAYLEHCSSDEQELAEIEKELCGHLDSLVSDALKVARPSASSVSMDVFAPVKFDKTVKPYSAKNVRNTNAINTALGHILDENSNAFVCGQDVGKYGSAFKTCKGLIDKYGSQKIVDTPICEAGTVGFCLGASQTGSLPVMEFQFADFSTEAVTQLGVNTGTWFFRSGKGAQLLFRLPNGGGITLGAFHSAEFDGLWSRFPGLKLFYPVTPQETYEALIAGFYDPNPCIVFEHKLLYWGKAGDIEFDGDLQKIYRPRQYIQGNDITIIATGAMVEQTLNAVSSGNYSASVWNPFILNPLSFEPILDSVRSTGRLLVVQEAGETAGMGAHFVSLAVQKCFSQLKCSPALISAPDTPVPFAKELESAYLPNESRIAAAIAKMIGDVK